MSVTTQALQSFQNIDNARHRTLITALVQKLHDYINEVQLTEDEWLHAIQFLTKTGQLCHEQRQEYILLSDVLGISMLVDQINHQKNEIQTPSTVFGPFFIENMPIRQFADSIVIEGEEQTIPLLITGQIRNEYGEAISNAYIDVWQTADNGMYSGQDDMQQIDNLRGVFISQLNGSYAIKSILPVSYQIPSDGTVGQLLNYAKRTFWRPAHIHFKIAAEGYQPLVTHLFLENDDYLNNDAVFGVKDRLIVSYQFKKLDEESKVLYGLDRDYYLITYDFVLSAE
ncbi:dioxygenase [Acinetobacter calcoaceticus]|uniref:dioxygenase family protein n=1 Tax=Acinetobacter calcoaceticus TaxID=471 RepID=UPI001E618F59|nr:dioxygenase [Acinetobacter calcoaceticus]UGQ30856.1 6-chlorohydroxyquinol-1,2-dioxygenase [Acinetobacter calcoaceticus]